MNYRYEMFKYQKIQSTADKMDVGNNEFFQIHFIEDICILQIVGHRNRLFVNNAN